MGLAQGDTELRDCHEPGMGWHGANGLSRGRGVQSEAAHAWVGVRVLGGCECRARSRLLGAAGLCQLPGPPAPGQSVPLSPWGHAAGGHSSPRCPRPRGRARHCRGSPGLCLAGHGTHLRLDPPTRGPLTILVTERLQEMDEQSQWGSLGTCHPPATPSPAPQPAGHPSSSTHPSWGTP